jgi:hypothetical protein
VRGQREGHLCAASARARPRRAQRRNLGLAQTQLLAQQRNSLLRARLRSGGAQGARGERKHGGTRRAQFKLARACRRTGGGAPASTLAAAAVAVRAACSRNADSACARRDASARRGE